MKFVVYALDRNYLHRADPDGTPHNKMTRRDLGHFCLRFAFTGRFYTLRQDVDIRAWATGPGIAHGQRDILLWKMREDL